RPPGGADEPRERPPPAGRAGRGGGADRERRRRRRLPLPRGAFRVPAHPLRRSARESDHRRLTAAPDPPPRTTQSSQEALMDTLQPPTPAEEITPAEPVQEVPEDDAASMLPELPTARQQELEQRADDWVEQVAELNPHSQEFTRSEERRVGKADS